MLNDPGRPYGSHQYQENQSYQASQIGRAQERAASPDYDPHFNHNATIAQSPKHSERYNLNNAFEDLERALVGHEQVLSELFGRLEPIRVDRGVEDKVGNHGPIPEPDPAPSTATACIIERTSQVQHLTRRARIVLDQLDI